MLGMNFWLLNYRIQTEKNFLRHLALLAQILNVQNSVSFSSINDREF